MKSAGEFLSGLLIHLGNQPVSRWCFNGYGVGQLDLQFFEK